MNDLRIKRNNSFYEGKKIDSIYLKDHKTDMLEIIKKLKETISKKL